MIHHRCGAMAKRSALKSGLLLGLVSLAGTAAAQAAPAPKAPTRPDLADAAAGTYAGEVIADARGSSQGDVTITVAKVGPDTVRVTSSYARLPGFTIRLTRAMNTIQQAGTSVVFLLDLSRQPHHLDITDDDASWSGEQR